jgi:hypothetical protein
MKTSPKAKMQRQPVELRFPPTEEWNNIVHDFKLTSAQAEMLKLTIEEAIDGLSRYQGKLKDRPSRGLLIDRLRRFEKALSSLRDECRRSAHLMHDFLPHDTLGYVGESLTFSATGEALGRNVFPKHFDSMIEVKRSVGERITLESMEELSRPCEKPLASRMAT